MQIVLPKHVRQIIAVLEAHGYEGYAVGGCVRDAILGRLPDDWDITTSAQPAQVKGLFRRTIDTGIEHGTVTVLMGENAYEVTTYRLDGKYEDSRHPTEVTFTGNLLEDLKRRDFTINAMAYNEKAGLVDVFAGKRDLEEGLIRCVGNARERFQEDALRILRAVRFQAQLGFAMEQRTAAAVTELAGKLTQISAERIQAELVKLLLSPHPEYLEQAWKLGITAVILPEFDRMMEMPPADHAANVNAGTHTLRALLKVPADKIQRLAVLFHAFGKPQVQTNDESGNYRYPDYARVSAGLAKDILVKLKFDNHTIRQVVRLVQYHHMSLRPEEKSIRRRIHTVGEDIFPLLLQLKKAVFASADAATQQRELPVLDEVEKDYQFILQRGDCLSLKTLAVSGRDLIAAGMKPGKEIGDMLEFLLLHVLDEPQHNNREFLIEYRKTFQ